MDRVAGPFVDEMKRRLGFVEFHVPAAEGWSRSHLSKGRAALRLQAQPGGDGKWLVAFETKLVPVLDPAFGLGAKTLIDRSFSVSPLSFQSAFDLLSGVTRSPAIGIQGEPDERTLGLG